jgi:hypothetical protein
MHQYRVAISRYHEGQMVYPCVTAQQTRDGVQVDLTWSGPAMDGKPDIFVGSVSDCEKWLEAQGVHLDAQGIY